LFGILSEESKENLTSGFYEMGRKWRHPKNVIFLIYESFLSKRFISLCRLDEWKINELLLPCKRKMRRSN
jgi:hypothetical protein